MDNQALIRLQHVNVSEEENIDILLTAVNDIQNTNEANFKHIKDKKWYKRLWGMITFSKDNEKVMAKNITSLAKMQDIVIKAILMASKDSKEIAEYLAGHTEQLMNMAKTQVKLCQAVAKMAYGYELRPDLRTMNEAHQYVIVSAVRKFVNAACQGDIDAMAKTYLGHLQSCCVGELNFGDSDFDNKKIDHLNENGHKLLAIILCEMSELIIDSEEKTAAFEEIIAYVGVSPIRLKAIAEKAKNDIRLLGKEFIASYYAGIDLDEELFAIDYYEMEFDENDPADDPNSEPKDTMELVDNTKRQYSQLKGIVGKYFPYVSGDTFGKETTDKINAFTDKNILLVDKDSVIAYVDETVFGSGTDGLLLTTHALYYKVLFQDIVKVPYVDIEYSRCKLQYDKKGKAKALDIVQKTGNVLSMDMVGVDNDKMLAMLVDISKLSLNEYAPTDSPISIKDMDYSVKLSYIKLIVNFLTSSKLSYAELMRFACDLELGEDELLEVAKYTVDSNESDLDLLLQINEHVPYASLKSLRYALIIEMFRQLQFIKHTSDILALEYEHICKIAKSYNFSDEDVARLKTVAQTEYKILTGEIKSDTELKNVQNALGRIALSSGVSVTTVVASNFWLLNAGWLRFIPGIGQILGILLIGKFIMDVFHEKKAFNEQRKKMIEKELESYRSARDRISVLFPDLVEEIKYLKKHIAWLRTMK